ncbi:hypothetical protein ABZ816_15710 [Actinosynnema sp. NPDC047251]|uniref:Putative secreted protein n=1 Tax=Saccharothrix espanaensis (strain ATCC 51144 / DSM 44229 / JCM 9112 / NBRC 15066 / NRRL 15764) TaxID=1179773 RepID=K0JZ48_SACES|nr:hypothetical protein [Saccharothrix espanaensis]CCH29533.1 putative secreted protein [Saccharothrix espanaensis DSM 44229]
MWPAKITAMALVPLLVVSLASRNMTSSAATSANAGSTWLQTGPLAFHHKLSGADRAYDKITAVPDLTIPFPGVWEVAYAVRTNIGTPSKGAALYVSAAVFVNGGIILGTEALTGAYFNPGEAVQDTVGQTFLHTFKVGDVLTLHAFRIGQDGTTDVLSNTDGRTRVTAHWVSPGF